MQKKVIIYGTGEVSRLVFSSFPLLLEYVDCFLESTHENEVFLGKPVINPDEEVFKQDNLIVISARAKVFELYGRLKMAYEVPDNNLMYIGEWIGKMFEEHPEIKISPTRVRIDCCTLCQLDCAECYMRKNNYGGVGNGYLKAADFESFLRMNPQITSVELSNNGEPFLNPELLDILRIAYEKNVSVSFFNGTNFNNVTEDILEGLVKYNVTGLNLSIDGASNETYRKYRRGGDYNAVISNIEKLNMYKKKYQSDNPVLDWQYVLMDGNEEDIAKAKDKAKELEMNIVFKLSWEGDYTPANPEMVKNVTGLDVFNRKQYFDKYGFAYNASSCRQLLFEPTINWNGDIYGCCGNYYIAFAEKVFGRDLDDVLNSSQYRSFVIDFLLGRNASSIKSVCSRCSSGEQRGMKNGSQMWI